MKIRDLNETEWAAWLASEPQSIRDLAARYPPDRLYRMTSTGQRVTLLSYSEDGTCRVDIDPVHNPERLMLIPLEVFGVDLADLVECDVPAEKGYVLTETRENADGSVTYHFGVPRS